MAEETEEASIPDVQDRDNDIARVQFLIETFENDIETDRALYLPLLYEESCLHPGLYIRYRLEGDTDTTTWRQAVIRKVPQFFEQKRRLNLTGLDR